MLSHAQVHSIASPGLHQPVGVCAATLSQALCLQSAYLGSSRAQWGSLILPVCGVTQQQDHRITHQAAAGMGAGA